MLNIASQELVDLADFIRDGRFRVRLFMLYIVRLWCLLISSCRLHSRLYGWLLCNRLAPISSSWVGPFLLGCWLWHWRWTWRWRWRWLTKWFIGPWEGKRSGGWFVGLWPSVGDFRNIGCGWWLGRLLDGWKDIWRRDCA